MDEAEVYHEPLILPEMDDLEESKLSVEEDGGSQVYCYEEDEEYAVNHRRKSYKTVTKRRAPLSVYTYKVFINNLQEIFP